MPDENVPLENTVETLVTDLKIQNDGTKAEERTSGDETVPKTATIENSGKEAEGTPPDRIVKAAQAEAGDLELGGAQVPQKTQAGNAVPTATGAELAFGTRRILRLHSSGQNADKSIKSIAVQPQQAGPDSATPEPRSPSGPVPKMAQGRPSDAPRALPDETVNLNQKSGSPENIEPRAQMKTAVLAQSPSGSLAGGAQETATQARSRFSFEGEQSTARETDARNLGIEAMGKPVQKPIPDQTTNGLLAQNKPLRSVEETPRSERRLSLESAPQSDFTIPKSANKTVQSQIAPPSAVQNISSQSWQTTTKENTVSAMHSIEGDPILGPRADLSSGPISSGQQHVQATAPLAHHVARQVAEAMQQMPNLPVEITLSPEELGRVRMSLSSTEAGIVVNVLTERPETADLMRRHISNLEAAFQEIGYSDISFAFHGGAEAQDDTSDGGSNNEPNELFAPAEDESGEVAQITLNTGPAQGLDLRL
jgi:flagellar hook-length control protein FliK